MTATLVTGASGFVGLNIVEALLSDGIDVVAFDTRAPPQRALREFAELPGALMTIEGDVTDALSLDRAFAYPVDRIIHAAAITSDIEREKAMPSTIVAVNVNGTVNVAKAAAQHDIRRVLLVSSAAVYGDLRNGEGGWREDSPLVPESLYAITKHAAESAFRRLGALYGLDIVVARLGWIFGPWEHRSGVRDTMSPVYQLTAAALARISAGLPRPDRRMWTYSRDAARALVALLSSDTRQDVYNVASGMRIDLSEWGDRLAETAPGFRLGIGDPSATVSIDLFSDEEPPGLSTARLDRELTIPWRDEDGAFEDYVRWLLADPWPCLETTEGNPS